MPYSICVYDKSEMLANKIVTKFFIYWDKMPLQGAIVYLVL